MKLNLFSTISVLTIAVASPSQSAELIRCNAMGPSGGFQPVLQVIEPNARTTIFMGEDGLAREIYYNDRRVYTYVREAMGIMIPNNRDEISHCGGRPNGEGAPSEAPAATADEVTPDPVTPDPVTPTIEADIVDPVTPTIEAETPTVESPAFI